jgi:hypothetical protein
MGAGRELAEEELLKDAVKCVACDAKEAVLEGQLCTVAVGGRVVEVGDGSGREVAEHVSLPR